MDQRWRQTWGVHQRSLLLSWWLWILATDDSHLGSALPFIIDQIVFQVLPVGLLFAYCNGDLPAKNKDDFMFYFLRLENTFFFHSLSIYMYTHSFFWAYSLWNLMLRCSQSTSLTLSPCIFSFPSHHPYSFLPSLLPSSFPSLLFIFLLFLLMSWVVYSKPKALNIIPTLSKPNQSG